MYQLKEIGGQFTSGVKVSSDIEQLLIDGELPNGLVGIDYDTGLVEVLVKDKKVHMKYGKLLSRLGYPEKIIPDQSAKVRSLVARRNGLSLSYARTEEEILHVYRNGPHSCMSNSDSVRIYACDDVAVAYAEVDGKIVARSVVVVNEDIGKQFIRIYGGLALLRPMLLKEGFTSGDLEGCELQLIEECEGIVCPYLDCGTNATESAGFLVVDSCGEWRTQSQNGYVYMDCCDHCGEAIHDEGYHYSDYLEADLCSGCFHEVHYLLEGNFYHIDSDEIVRLHDGDYALKESACYSEYHSEYFYCDDVVYTTHEEEYFKHDEVVYAWVFDDNYYGANEWENITCHKEDCTRILGEWVQDNSIDEYLESKGIAWDKSLQEIAFEHCPDLRQGLLEFKDTHSLPDVVNINRLRN